MLQKINDYEIIEKIASGGMADVFKAKKLGAKGFTKIFAIKIIKQELLKKEESKNMFIQEAELTAKLIHPNIIQIFELGEENFMLYLVMEYVHGKNLKEIDKLIGFKKLDWKKNSYIVYKAAQALHYAHEMKDYYGQPLHIIHRDVSPQNIMITFSGEVKVADFGIAKVAKSTEKKGQIAGKFPYMSPEQTKGYDLDRRSDVFSLGTVYYQLLTGNLPFIGKDETDIVKSIRTHNPEPPYLLNPDVPKAISNLVMKCLEKEPDFRFNNALELALEIEKYLPNAVEIADKLGKMLLEKYTVNLSQTATKSESKTVDSVESQITKTLGSYLELLREEPNNTVSIEKIASVYILRKNYDKAMEYLTRGLAIDDASFNMRFRLCQIFLRKKDKFNFKHNYRILEKIDPGNINLELLYLQYLIMFEKQKLVKDYLDKLQPKLSDNIEFLIIEAEYYLNKKEYTNVIKNYLKIAEIEPEYAFFKEEVKKLIEDLYVSMFKEDGAEGVDKAEKEKKEKDSETPKYKALVIDDEKNTRILLKILLTDFGFSVDLAQNAFNVEKLLEMHEYDIVLLDVLMPGKNGFKIVEELTSKKLLDLTRTKVIMMSGVYKSMDFKLKAKKMGIDDYIEKPFSTKQILKAIRKYINVSSNK